MNRRPFLNAPYGVGVRVREVTWQRDGQEVSDVRFTTRATSESGQPFDRLVAYMKNNRFVWILNGFSA